MQNGLGAAIMNPLSAEMMKAYTCFCTLSGYDEHCSKYIEFAGKYSPALSAAPSVATSAATHVLSALPPSEGENTLEDAIIRGKITAAARAASELLISLQPLDIINKHLIPALDIVGRGFEEKRFYLPQLLMSAEASKAAFTEIRAKIEKDGGKQEMRGAVILATVKGDIHDIGKNIVRALLENYGYAVIDLGRDVPVHAIIEAAVKHSARLVGLSALMTTTVPAMAETIRLLRKTLPECKVAVGGAVLTQEYADMIGADFYGRDAISMVGIAKKVFGEN